MTPSPANASLPSTAFSDRRNFHAWGLFGERFGPMALTGMALTAVGVALINLRR